MKENLEKLKKERELLRKYVIQNIISYKLGLEGSVSGLYLKNLDNISTNDLIQTCIELNNRYKEKLYQKYNVDCSKKL